MSVKLLPKETLFLLAIAFLRSFGLGRVGRLLGTALGCGDMIVASVGLGVS
jgi:hypothetical protein